MATALTSPSKPTIDVRKVRRGRRVRYVASIPSLMRTVLGDYPTREDAHKAGELMLAMNDLGGDHLCTPADIDRVRKALASKETTMATATVEAPKDPDLVPLNQAIGKPRRYRGNRKTKAKGKKRRS